eukprot:CAMPEP_0198147476 /NCGR_PEP_ID=MMETSP1443-20131203/35960_1 /TAXON_ID=186043 /ORGANISM="Entomoneis sp., Strain CCMP2396" /LENGTH=345 /DNA_ID=CAMNT_0043811831 /DNA_START=30 /DNA_END=1067 /DNA_ORIENTATION=+
MNLIITSLGTFLLHVIKRRQPCCWLSTPFHDRRVCSLNVAAPQSDTRATNPIDQQETSSSVTLKSATSSSCSAAVYSGPWVQRAVQLLQYYQQHGHCLVPKRFKENQSLGNWVNKQRQEYRKFLAGETPCSLSEERIEILNQMGFCWDASQLPNTPPPQQKVEERDDEWWSMFQELESYMGEHKLENVHSIPFKSTLYNWIMNVRMQYCTQEKEQRATLAAAGANNNVDIASATATATLLILSQKQIYALDKLDPNWHLSPREALWERRFNELLQYRQKYGDCCVPISFSENKQLANWVSTQRKQYNLRQRGHKSGLTDVRFKLLQEIGFVWNRWEYEFAMKQFD